MTTYIFECVEQRSETAAQFSRYLIYKSEHIGVGDEKDKNNWINKSFLMVTAYYHKSVAESMLKSIAKNSSKDNEYRIVIRRAGGQFDDWIDEGKGK